jgi:TetR/AcrR family transcriptional regulator, transcriptional repressor for nem operon
MGRRPSYERQAIIEAASELFWEHGYQSTSIGDLEERTGLDRSSLYHAFGSKQAVFEEALRRYVDEFDDRLVTALQAGGGLEGVAGVFAGMARAFRSDPTGNARGCLMVNTVAELGSHDPVSSRLGAEYRDRLRQAFAAALREAAERGQLEPDQIQPRGNLLASLVMGLFLTARIDPVDAAEVCDDVAGEVSSWRARSESNSP